MPRRAFVVQIFVASPSDVSEEREQLEILVSEMNRTWSKHYGVVFEVMTWEKDVRPAFGPDPQQVINSQIGDDYDIFIGLLWSKFGTATPRAESGTLEEFERAYERWSVGGGKPEIMIYFKDSPLLSSLIDPDQIRKIQDFKKKISEKGGVYGSFKDSEGFRSSLRAHLSAIAKKTAQEYIGLGEENKFRAGVGAKEQAEDEPGYLDFIERFESVMPELGSVLEEINEATSKMCRELSERTSEVERLDTGLQNRRDLRKTVKYTSENFETYAQMLGYKIPLFSSLASRAFDALSNVLALQGDFSGAEPDDLDDLRQNLTALLEAIESSRVPVASFKDAVNKIPRLTSEMNGAKRSVSVQLSAFLEEISRVQTLIKNVLVSVTTMQEGTPNA